MTTRAATARRALRTSLLVLCALSCRATTGGVRAARTQPGEILITERVIAECAARTAWDAIKCAAPQINFREQRDGQPVRAWRRGRGSIYLSEAPLLFVDGVRTSDLRVLDMIPAATIFSIQILTGIDGTTYYGTNAVGGVILVATKNGS